MLTPVLTVLNSAWRVIMSRVRSLWQSQAKLEEHMIRIEEKLDRMLVASFDSVFLAAGRPRLGLGAGAFLLDRE